MEHTARLPRSTPPGQPQHAIQRGNNRGAIFRALADYRSFLEKVAAAATRRGREIHAYVLMINHVPVLPMLNRGQGTGKTMQMLGRDYVLCTCRRMSRHGSASIGSIRG